ncbi:hypothetical protein PIB30_098531, partial [Stylosanthes scabra]|nr:hypothetical protein [Stylosanthes scabra]
KFSIGLGEHINHLQALFSQRQAEPQPQPVVMPGQSSIDYVRPPLAIASGGHCTGRASVDSWISGGDHRRGPIVTQHSADFNESTSVGVARQKEMTTLRQ